MPDPEVLEWELSDQDAFFVLASDGVWEFLSSTQVHVALTAHGNREPDARIDLSQHPLPR